MLIEYVNRNPIIESASEINKLISEFNIHRFRILKHLFFFIDWMFALISLFVLLAFSIIGFLFSLSNISYYTIH